MELPQGLPSSGIHGWVYANRDEPIILEEPESDNDVIDEGKWMLFYPKGDMDARWLEACERLQFGEFGVVNEMKASTFGHNFSSTKPKGVIVLYIQRAKKAVVMDTGRIVMEAMQYNDTMFYKTNRQTRDEYQAFERREDASHLKKHALQLTPEYKFAWGDEECLHT